jgi:hypothetical protein
MAIIKTGTTIGNVAADKKRVDDLGKLAEGGIAIATNIAS